MNALWKDERGAALTIEVILMASIVGIGMIAGLVAFRDSVSQEFGDASAGLAAMNQGYQYIDTASSGSIDNLQFRFSVSGSEYVDESNFCEPAVLDPAGDSPMCMEISAAMVRDEGT